MTVAYWAVAQTFAGMENLVRCDIEEAGKGAFLPTYVVTRIRRGRKVDSNRPLVPGYVFFQTSPEDWAGVAAVEGVSGVLCDADGLPRRVHSMETHRLMLEHAFGQHDVSLALAPARRARSRKPRRSKRARFNTVP
jgi:transcription antitermination factor NusG